MMVGYFSAASCITGVLADDIATTLLLHQYGALSVWDYTSAGKKKNIYILGKLSNISKS